MRYYTGVGSRETPIDILIIMAKVANILEKKGFILRSGAAEGADSAFEFGLENPNQNSEIYTISKKTKRNKHPYKNDVVFFVPEIDNKALYDKANKLMSVHNLHPRWNLNMDESARKLHSRNLFQVLGKTLSDHPTENQFSKFNLCYTKDGAKKGEDTTINTGGTGTSIRASSLYKIPVYNLANIDDRQRIEKFIAENENLLNMEHIHNIILYSPFNPKNLTIKELIENNQRNIPVRKKVSI